MSIRSVAMSLSVVFLAIARDDAQRRPIVGCAVESDDAIPIAVTVTVAFAVAIALGVIGTTGRHREREEHEDWCGGDSHAGRACNPPTAT